MLFFVVITGVFPFKGATDEELYRKIRNCEYPKHELLTNSKELSDLISKMLKVKDQERITAGEILCHPWITKNNLNMNLTSNAKILLSEANCDKFEARPLRGDSYEYKKRTTTTISSNKDRDFEEINHNCVLNNVLNETSKLNNIYPLPLDKGSQKLADTYKENLKLELRLVKQSPSNAPSISNKITSATNRRFEKI